MKSFPILFLVVSILFLASCETRRINEKLKDIPSEIAAGPGEQQASGFVYHDKNHNRKRDKNEPGIRDVIVSNGTDMVVTDSDGKYALPVSDDAIILVVKPKEWMTPVNEDNLPQFYYIHKPEGSPAHFKYKGSDPTSKLPEEVNFPLYEETYSTDFKMVVFGDTQPYTIEQVDYVAEDIVTELVGQQGLEFGMTMGDIVGDDLNLFNPLNQVVAAAGIPWYNVLGNHDMNFDAPDDEKSDETFERVYGPATYAFIYGDVHFIVIDDVIHSNVDGDISYVGGLRPDQFTFVENYLKTVPYEDLVVLTMHIPLAQHGEWFRKSDQAKLFELLQDFPNNLSISAHSHIQENMFFRKDSSDWLQDKPHHHFNVGTTSGSWWLGMRGETNIPHTMMRDGTPNGYSFITFKGTKYVIDWKVAGSPADHRMNIHLPRGIVAGSDDNPILTVNYFNGSEESIVEYRIKGETDWMPMRRSVKFDPYYEMLFQHWEDYQRLEFIDQWKNDSITKDKPFPGRRLPRPRLSTHLWEAEIGTDWRAGRYVVEVRVKDRYGRTFASNHPMRVVSPQK